MPDSSITAEGGSERGTTVAPLAPSAAVLISMLRGVNVGGHHRIAMPALRALYESLDLRNPQTYIQSGNVIFRTDERDHGVLARRISDGIERIGFRSAVILRTASDLRGVIARNPFAARSDIHASRLLITFLVSEPAPEARDALMKIPAEPEELRLAGRELYTHFPNGMARPKVPWSLIEKTLKTSGTGRNWSTVMKLLEMAERMEFLE